MLPYTPLPILLIFSITNLVSSLPTLPDLDHLHSLPGFTILNAAQPGTLIDTHTIAASNTLHTLSTLNLPVLPLEQTLQLTRLTNTANLTSLTSNSTSRTIAPLLRRSIQAQNSQGNILLRATGSTFLAPVTFGSQTFNLIVDTGSSDTWVARSDFTCVDVVTGSVEPQGKCAFGSTYSLAKESSSFSSDNGGNGNGNKFKQIPNENFNVTYGDGEYLTGIFGSIDVSLGNSDVKVPNQQVALATVAGWNGDGVTSGILGLAYPALTGAFSGMNPDGDRVCHSSMSPSQCNQVEYPPVLLNAFEQNVTGALFSVALSRDESRSGKGGYLTVGGLPDLKSVGVMDGRFASVPVRMLTGDGKYRYYLVESDGVVVLPVGAAVPGSSSGSGSRKRADIGDGDGVNKDGESVTEVEEVEAEEISQAGSMGVDGMKLKREDNDADASSSAIRFTSPLVLPRSTSITSRTRTRSRKSTSSATPSTSTTKPPTYPTTKSSTSTNTAGLLLLNSQSLPFIIDTGTILSFLPRPLIQKYLSMFSPPGTYDPTSTFWFVDCSAQVPPLGIKLGGATFWFNNKDMIKRVNTGQGHKCISGVQESTGLGVNVLGDVWLDSVLVVFDFRRSEFVEGLGGSGGGVVRVASRREYVS